MKQFCIGGRGAGADELGLITRSLFPSQTSQIIVSLQRPCFKYFDKIVKYQL